MSGKVVVQEISEFTFGRNCVYMFPKPLTLNAMPMRGQPGFIVVNRQFDPFFIGVGKTVESGIYDWESKFHGYYQRFERLGYFTEKEEQLYELMSQVMDKKVYRENRCCTKIVSGEIVGCREEHGLFPCSYKLDNSGEMKPFPEYTTVDAQLMTLEKGDRFKGVFEYRLSDGSLKSVLHIERLSNEEKDT